MRVNSGSRVVVCGAVSQYSGNLNKGKVYGMYMKCSVVWCSVFVCVV